MKALIKAVLRIRIRWFLGLLDPYPFVRGTDLAQDPSIIKEKDKKNLDSYCFVISLWLFIFEKLCKCTFKSNKQKNLVKNN